VLVSLHAKKILVVEDDGDLREEIAAFITDLGVEVQQACDGVEGLEHLANGPPPAAILLDMRMPRLDGPGFLEALRGEPHLADIPVVTMTGDPDAVPGGPIASRLQKPLDVEELARIMVSLCEA
jgi:two-component system, chemotaxis family, chemotaxis protein CheY